MEAYCDILAGQVQVGAELLGLMRLTVLVSMQIPPDGTRI